MAGFDGTSLAILLIFYPETKLVPLEQMDEVFDDTNRVLAARQENMDLKTMVGHIEVVEEKTLEMILSSDFCYICNVTEFQVLNIQGSLIGRDFGYPFLVSLRSLPHVGTFLLCNLAFRYAAKKQSRDTLASPSSYAVNFESTTGIIQT